ATALFDVAPADRQQAAQSGSRDISAYEMPRDVGGHSSLSTVETVIGALGIAFVVFSAASEGRLGALVMDFLGPIAFVVGALSLVAVFTGSLSYTTFSLIAAAILSFFACADGSFSGAWVLVCSVSWAISCALV